MKPILLSFGICLMLLVSPTFVLAQTTPAPATGQQTQSPIAYKSIVELPLPNAASGENGVNRDNITAEQFVMILYALSITIAALLAVIKIIYGGVQYMLTDVVTSKAGAKKDIYGAVLGLIIVLSAVFILETINPQLSTLSLFRQGAGAGLQQGGTPPAVAPANTTTTGVNSAAELRDQLETCQNLINVGNERCCNDTNSCQLPEEPELSQALTGYQPGRVYNVAEIVQLLNDNGVNEENPNIVDLGPSPLSLSDEQNQQSCNDLASGRGWESATAYVLNQSSGQRILDRVICVRG